MTPPDVVVETLAFSAEGERLRVRTLSGALHDEHPDRRALDLAGATHSRPEALVCHSTSWRYDDTTRTVVLTYAVLPDPYPERAVPVDDAPVVASGDPARPSPPQLHAHHVIAHALRHLAGLAASDPAVVTVAETDPTPLWQRVRAAAGRATVVPIDPHPARPHHHLVSEDERTVPGPHQWLTTPPA